VLGPDEVAIGHLGDRTPRRWFLMGENPIPRKDSVLRSRPDVVTTWYVIERSGKLLLPRELLTVGDGAVDSLWIENRMEQALKDRREFALPWTRNSCVSRTLGAAEPSR